MTVHILYSTDIGYSYIKFSTASLGDD